MSTTRKGRCASRLLLAVLAVGILSGGVIVPAGAIEVEWLGVTTAWSNPANWSPEQVPDFNVVARIPLVQTGNFPEITVNDAFCRGLILDTGSKVTVTMGSALYIVNPEGDLDGDGITDEDENATGDMDIDIDGIPNFADTDMDGDGMSDACEDEYDIFNPYENPIGVEGEGDTRQPYNDYDGDEVSNLKECEAGTDPTSSDDYPVSVPVSHIAGLLALFATILILSILILPQRDRNFFRIVVLCFATTFLLYFGYWGIDSVYGAPVYPPGMEKAENTYVDFDINSTKPAIFYSIPDALLETEENGTIHIDGSSDRPWNGRSTYVNRPAIIKADGGTVYLGGMRTNFDVALHGEGDVIATSRYTGDDYDGIYSSVSIGTGSVSCFLGEWLDLYATPDEKFVEWSGDASGSISNTQFQAADHGMTVEAIFLSPGMDLAGQWADDGIPAVTSSEGVISVSATLRVHNIGQKTTGLGTWFDGLFLSRDEVYDSDTDLELAVASYTGELEFRNEYTVPLTGTIPDVAPGVYYILGVTDESNVVAEVNNNNNTVATEIVVLDANLAQ